MIKKIKSLYFSIFPCKHYWAWLSTYDRELFLNGQTTGPLVCCIKCGANSRVEYGFVKGWGKNGKAAIEIFKVA